MEKLLYKYPITTILATIFLFLSSIVFSEIIKSDWGQIFFMIAAYFFAIFYLGFSTAIGLQLAEDNNLPNKWFWGSICFFYPILGIRFTKKHIKKLKSAK